VHWSGSPSPSSSFSATRGVLRSGYSCKRAQRGEGGHPSSWPRTTAALPSCYADVIGRSRERNSTDTGALRCCRAISYRALAAATASGVGLVMHHQ
jgi:hypothetical protein